MPNHRYHKFISGFFLLALAAAVVLTASPAFSRDAAVARKAPGSRVALEVPAAYQPSKRFAGFEEPVTGASVVVVEMPPQAYAHVESGMTSDALATRGMRDVVIGRLERDGAHVYVRAKQPAPPGDYEKFILLLPGKDITALVTFNVPVAAIRDGRADPAQVERILARARIDETAAAAMELFTLSYLGPFKRAGSLAGATVLYNLDGSMPARRVDNVQPTLIVAPSFDARAIGDVEKYSRRVLQQISGMTAVEVVAAKAVTVDGMKGVELTATATDAALNEDVSLYQLVLPGRSGGYYRLLGLSANSDGAAYLETFRRIAASFKAAPGGGR